MTIFSPYCAILLSLSLALLVICILPTLINLFKNHHHHHHHQNIHSFIDFPGGIGLIVAAIRHVIVKKPPSSPRKRDAGENVGLTSSCTESLGFESSDEIRTDDPITENLENKDSIIIDEDYCCGRRTTAAEGGESENWRRKMRNHVKKEAKSFPPPLSSLNVKGQPSFFLRPIRKDGRLELTEVRIHRPEILHVWRHDGRLTLHLIPDETILDDDREQQEQEQEQEREIAELEQEIAESEGEVAEPEEENLEEEEEEVGFGDRSFGIGSNEGIRWCHEAVNHHHIRNVHLHHRHHHNHPLHVSGLGIA